MDLIKALLPTLATALVGPLGGAAVEFIAGKLGVDDKTKDGISNALSGMTGDQLVKMKELDNDLQKHLVDAAQVLQLGQIGTNTEEAKSDNWFVAGGRPAIMWICGIAFAYSAVIEPFVRFIAQVGFHYNGLFPVIDTDITQQVLYGILGLGAARTIEKVKGVAR